MRLIQLIVRAATYSHSKPRQQLVSTRALNRLLAKSLKLNAKKKQATFFRFFQAKLALRHLCAFFSASELKQIKVFLRAPLSHPNVKVFLIKLGFPPQGHHHRVPPTTWHTIFAKLRCHPAWLEYCAAPLENVTHEQSLTLDASTRRRDQNKTKTANRASLVWRLLSRGVDRVQVHTLVSCWKTQVKI